MGGGNAKSQSHLHTAGVDTNRLIKIITNFGEGFRRLLELGLYITFKDKLGLEPAEITFLLSIMAFPWVMKIFMAIFTDNISLFGSRRRNYIILNASLNIVFINMLMMPMIAWLSIVLGSLSLPRLAQCPAK